MKLDYSEPELMIPGVAITILWLRSQTTGRKFPTVQFSADTDMAIFGLVSLTSLESREIVITDLSPDEMERPAPQGLLACEDRVNAQLGRHDLRCIWFTGEHVVRWGSRRLLYRDPFVPNGKAELIRQESLARFRLWGGRVIRFETKTWG